MKIDEILDSKSEEEMEELHAEYEGLRWMAKEAARDPAELSLAEEELWLCLLTFDPQHIGEEDDTRSEAIQRYFRSRVFHKIRGERFDESVIKRPHMVVDYQPSVMAIYAKYQEDYGVIPIESDLIHYAPWKDLLKRSGLTSEQLISGYRTNRQASLDDEVGVDTSGIESTPITLGDTIADPTDYEKTWDLLIDINSMLYDLTYEHRQAIYMRSEGYTFEEIGAELGVSRETIRKWIDKDSANIAAALK